MNLYFGFQTINPVHYECINESMDKLSQLDSKLSKNKKIETFQSNKLIAINFLPDIKLSKQSFGCGNSQENIFF